MDVNPIELQRHLKGADYPASKDELVSLAERNDAPADVVEALRDAGADNFEGPDEVQAAIAQGD
jgi:Protein of unknown function (DUF2795)